MSGIDRIVAQEYVIDTIHYFDGDNNELARRLGIGELLSLSIYLPVSGGIACIPIAVQATRQFCMHLSLSDSLCLHVGMAECCNAYLLLFSALAPAAGHCSCKPTGVC